MTKLLMPAVLVLLSSLILSATLFADAPEPKAYLFFALGLLVLFGIRHLCIPTNSKNDTLSHE